MSVDLDRLTDPRAGAQRVSVVDVDMPFGSMVVFMVKWAVATIPAVFILVGVGLFIVMLLTTLGRGL